MAFRKTGETQTLGSVPVPQGASAPSERTFTAEDLVRVANDLGLSISTNSEQLNAALIEAAKVLKK